MVALSHRRRRVRPFSRWWTLAALSISGGAFAGDSCDTDDLHWMIGSWQSRVEGTLFTERWSAAGDAQLRGHAESFRVSDGSLMQREVMTIHDRGSGLVYEVDVNADGDTVVFELVQCDTAMARFENPHHDFPQRLHYELLEGGGLVARVSDLDGNGFDLEFTPADAPSAVESGD